MEGYHEIMKANEKLLKTLLYPQYMQSCMRATAKVEQGLLGVWSVCG